MSRVSRDGVFGCDVCSQVFTRRVSLKEHKHIHTNCKPYQCLTCGQTFRQISNYKKHQKRHLKTTDPTVKEVSSGSSTRAKTCDVCGRHFSTQWALTSHSLSHNQFKSCLCDKCGNTFKYRCDLVRHMKIHDNHRQYKCDVCPLGFNDMSALKRHRIRVHKNDKKCTNDANVGQSCGTSDDANPSDSETIDLNDANYVNSVIDFINVCRILPQPLPCHIFEKSVELQREIGIHLGTDDKCAKTLFSVLRTGLQDLNQIIGEHLHFKYKSIIY